MKKSHFFSAATHLSGVGIFLLLLSGCSHETSELPQTEYGSMTVGLSDVETVEKFPATIRGRQDVDIYPQVSGKLTSVNVREGERVKKGQTLFVIDQVPYKAALQTAEANLSSAKAGVSSARLDYEGKKELFGAKVISSFELQKAENALMVAEAARDQAAASVTDARNNLSSTVITSPCDGVVGTIPFRAGYLVSPGLASPLTTISDNSEMYVYFSMPENRMIEMIRTFGSADKVLEAMPPVSLYLNDGSVYESAGNIESISGVLDSSTGTTSVRAVFKNPSGLLHSGGAGNVGLVRKSIGVIQIPQSATYELQDKVYAYRVSDGKAHAVRIEVEPVKADNSYIVRSGLKTGDVIVTEGVGNLQDGAEITLKSGGPAADKSGRGSTQSVNKEDVTAAEETKARKE